MAYAKKVVRRLISISVGAISESLREYPDVPPPLGFPLENDPHLGDFNGRVPVLLLILNYLEGPGMSSPKEEMFNRQTL